MWARAVLRMLAGWGITRLSVRWGVGCTRSMLEQIQAWGYEVNLYAVPDLALFLQAVLLLPDSLTADFNFPDWHYYGRGSGERHRYHRYRVGGVSSPYILGVAPDGTGADPTGRDTVAA